MSEGPKLYTNKPKKGQLKQKAKDFSTPAPNPSVMGPTPTAPPPPPKESFARRYKFLWPMLLTVNLAIGAYLFMRTKNKDTDAETVESAAETPAPIEGTTAPVTGTTLPVQPSAEAIKVRQPIPANEQRELFKWMLEEKRKVRPSDPLEKKRIDEEKAILKQYIRGKSIPSF